MHVPFGYFPDPVGGTEIYVQGLAGELAGMGFDNVICAPGRADAAYDHEGLPVRRFAVTQGRVKLRDLYGEGDDCAAAGFEKILQSERPDLVHFHAFTMGVSVKALRRARHQGCRVLFTYHTPTVSCVRGTLRHGGKCTCDGRLEIRRCGRCLAKHWGFDALSASMLGSLPPRFGAALGEFGWEGGVWTALRCTELVGLRHAAIGQLFREVDHLVAVCDWVRELLVRNGVAPERITLCRQGVSIRRMESVSDRPVPIEGRIPGSGLRIAYLGRMHPTKGADDLIAAILQAPELEASLDIYGVAQNPDDDAYVGRLRASAAADPRITFRAPVTPGQAVDLLKGYDVLAVPSHTLETGPLVALEAFAAGIPVIGPKLGGLQELVRHGVNGLLIEPPAIQGWVDAFRQCARDLELLPRLRSGIQPPRTMRTVAEEMGALYLTFLNGRCASSTCNTRTPAAIPPCGIARGS